MILRPFALPFAEASLTTEEYFLTPFYIFYTFYTFGVLIFVFLTERNRRAGCTVQALALTPRTLLFLEP